MSSEPEYSYERRLEVAVLYLSTTDTEEISKLTGINGRTIRYWLKASWWPDMITQAKEIRNKELDAHWTSLIHKATMALHDRLENGEMVVVKGGEVKRVPLKARDLAIITTAAVDRRALLRGEATSRSERVTVKDRLSEIEKGLAQIGKPEEETDDKVKH